MGKNNLDFYEKSFIDILDEYVFMLDGSGEIYSVNNTVLKELNCDFKYISKMNFFEISSLREEDLLKSDREKISSISIILGNTKLYLNNINIIKKNLENKESYIILGKREKKMFMMDMSHELRTPINIILSTIQLLKKNIDDEVIVCNGEINLISYLDSIKRNSFRILNLVNTIMDINKIEEGYYKVNNKECEIVSAIESIIQSIVKYGEAKNLQIIFDTNVEEKFILCDIEKIEHILLNLLSNSIKYTNASGKIQVFLEVLEEEIKVSVKDNGIGIDKESLDMIFDRFYQGNNHKKLLKKSKGSGVGLFLVKSLVKIQNGTIFCTSEQEKGSEFVFTLPVTSCENKKEEWKEDFNFCVNEYFEV